MNGQDEVGSLSGKFKVFVISKFFIVLGSGFFTILLPWMSLSITGSTLFTGIIEGIVAIPLLTSFITGAFIDKVSMKKNLFLISVFGIALATASLVFSLSLHTFLLIILAITVPVIIISYLDDIQATSSSYFDKILLTDKQLKKGIAIRRGTRSIARISGMAIFSYFIIFGFVFSIYFLVIIYFVAGLIFFTIRQNIVTEHIEKSESIEFLHGIKKFLSNPFLKELTILSIIMNLFFGMISVGFAVLVKSFFNLDGSYFSYILISLALGDAFGSILSSHTTNVKGKIIGTISITSGFLFLTIYLFSTEHLYFALIPVTFFIGLLSGIMNGLVYAMMIKNTEPDLIGSTFGSFSSLFGGITFISGFIAGFVLIYLPAPSLFLLIGLPIIGTGILSSFSFPNLRKVSL
jgi:hypothetical protein